MTLVLVPGIMAKENWDDHDESNRYTARDIAKMYLDSCEPNAIFLLLEIMIHSLYGMYKRLKVIFESQSM